MEQLFRVCEDAVYSLPATPRLLYVFLLLLLDKWSNGFVYVKMLAQPEAQRVKELMHGR